MRLMQIIYVLVFFIGFLNPAYSLSCKEDPDMSEIEARPEIESGYHSETEVQIEINKNPRDVKAWFDNVAPERVIKGTPKVSGIAKTRNFGPKPWGSEGSMRMICNKDDNTTLEQILENNPGENFKYELWDFTTDKTNAIKYAVAEFKVIPVSENKSLLQWTVAFRPSMYLYRIPLNHYVKNNFKEYMEASLVNIKNLLES